MISYEKAKAKALELEPKVDTCYEYVNAYRFVTSNEDADGVSDVVVLKDSGKVMGFMQYIMKYHPDPKLNKIDF